MTPGHLQGVTLYSFTRLFHDRKYDLEGLIQEVAKRKLGPGLEIIGFSSFRGFPNLASDYVSKIRNLIESLGLIPTSLAANADFGLRRDRNLTPDEAVEYMAAQIKAAKQLGFPLVRVQISLTPDDMERLLPIAEEAKIKLGLEVHAHHSPMHPDMVAHRERYEKLDSGLLGFVPDFGATTVAVSPSLLEKYRRLNMPEEFLDILVATWKRHHQAGPPMTDKEQAARFGEFIGLAHQHGYPDLGVELAVNLTGLHGHANPEDWASMLHLVWHTHAKFFGIVDGDEPATPLADLMRVFSENNYTGSMSSEYEGWHWNWWDDPFEMVEGHQAAIRRHCAANGRDVRTVS